MVDSTPFCTNVEALSEGSPEVSPVEPPDQCPVQAGRSALAATAGGEGTRVPSGPVGAFTGLDLPKATLHKGPVGPDLPPLRPGLPYTPIEACQELMLAIVAQGLADDDLAYVVSPTFIHHLLYVGLDPDVALQVKVKYLRGEIRPARIRADLLAAERVSAAGK
ncbi:hypothetical protein GmRootV59_36650 [Variovorax sp. V59]